MIASSFYIRHENSLYKEKSSYQCAKCEENESIVELYMKILRAQCFSLIYI